MAGVRPDADVDTGGADTGADADVDADVDADGDGEDSQIVRILKARHLVYQHLV